MNMYDEKRRQENIKSGKTLCERCEGTGNQFYSMYSACEDCGGSGLKPTGFVFSKKKLTVKELWNAWTFDWGVNQPAPYIWFGWWLITFDPLKISFLPD